MVERSVSARASSWVPAALSPGLLATSCQAAWKLSSAAATPPSPGSAIAVSKRTSEVERVSRKEEAECSARERASISGSTMRFTELASTPSPAPSQRDQSAGSAGAPVAWPMTWRRAYPAVPALATLPLATSIATRL